MERTYRVGTRTSPLALRQVEEVLDALSRFHPAIRVEVVGIDTYGDKDKDTPISKIEGGDFFTREIDEALLRGEVNFAIHSAKDLPDRLRDGLVIAAQTESVDPYDVLVSKSGLGLDELAYRANIGTSSLRRKEGLKRYRPDFQIVDIRGNIEERLKLLDNNDGGDCFVAIAPRNDETSLRAPKGRSNLTPNIEAIVIAAAGLVRLGLENRITRRIPFEILRPHPLQGSLAIVVREGDREIIRLLSKLDTRKEVCRV